MRPPPFDDTRRVFLRRSAGTAGLVLFAATLGNSRPAVAKAAKAEFMYQDHRHNGKGCAECKFFSPDGLNGQFGACAIIEGPVSRVGWCMAFAPRILA